MQKGSKHLDMVSLARFGKICKKLGRSLGRYNFLFFIFGGGGGGGGGAEKKS